MPLAVRPFALTPLAVLAAVEVRSSSIHGLGAFAIADFAEGQVIGAYEGRRHATGSARPAWDGKSTYLFSLSDGSFIDGRVGGNATRHINHSCKPNVVAIEELGRRRRLVVTIVAKHAIRPGDELLLDYALDLHGEDPSSYPCCCGESNCRGTMAVPRRLQGSPHWHR